MTTYIESKLNPDGTYDHSEVIEAHNKRVRLESCHPSGCVWRPIDDWEKSSWNELYKYRAVIEDKPRSVQPVSSISATELSRHVRDKFQSDSPVAVPLNCITLTREEVNEVFPGLLK